MDLQGALIAVGFTEYEARVYLTLLQDYPNTGYQISKKSGVPRSMVYEALGRLRTRGAVLESKESRATLYRPLPPDVLLDHHEQEQRHVFQKLRSGLGELYISQDEDYVWSIAGKQAVLAYAAQMIQRAQKEVFLVLDDDDVGNLEGEIAATCQRGIKVGTLLTGKVELTHGEVAYHPPLESELQELTDTLLVVTDCQEVLIARNHYHEATATITRNRNLVLIARQFVWMELFAQRIYAQLGPDVLAQLQPADRQIFESMVSSEYR